MPKTGLDGISVVQSKLTYPVRRCTEEFLDDTPYGKKFYEYNKEMGNWLYCAENPDIYLQGTMDTQSKKEETAYVIYQVLQCTDGEREKRMVDPKCVDTLDKPCPRTTEFKEIPTAECNAKKTKFRTDKTECESGTEEFKTANKKRCDAIAPITFDDAVFTEQNCYVDPPCEEDADKIINFFDKKVIHFRVLNEKIDFTIENQPTR